MNQSAVGVRIAPYVLGIAFFVLPFVRVSCAGTPVVSCTGVQLVTGVEVPAPTTGQTTRQSGEPFAAVALLALAVGAGLSVSPKRSSAIWAGLAGVVAVASMLILKTRMDAEATKHTLMVDYLLGFWLVWLSAAVGIVLSIARARDQAGSAPVFQGHLGRHNPLAILASAIAGHPHLLSRRSVACVLAGLCALAIAWRWWRPPGPVSTPAGMGYLAASGDSVWFIQWTADGNQLTGQLQSFSPPGFDPGRTHLLSSGEHSFEGAFDHGNVSIRCDGRNNWTGTLARDGLTLVIPASDGRLLPVLFRAASVQDYNNAVTRLRQAREEAASKAASQRAVAAASEAVVAAIGHLFDTAKSLENLPRCDEVGKAYASAWEKMQADYQSMKAAADKRPLDSYQLGTVEYRLGTVEYDLGTIQYHRGSFDAELREGNEGIARTRDAMAGLRKAWDELRQAMAADSTGTRATPASSEAEVSGALQAAQQAIAKLSERARLASNRADAYDSQAASLCERAKAFVRNLKASDTR